MKIHTVKTNLISIAVSAGLLTLTACGSGSSGNGIAISNTYQGIWLAPAYGKGIEIKSNSLSQFDYTSDFCLIDEEISGLDSDELESALILDNSHTQFELKLGFGAGDIYAPGIIYSKVNEMPSSCLSGFTPKAGEPNYEVNFEQDLDYFYQTFKELSISIELQQVDWEGLYISAKQKLSSDPTDTTLILELIRMMKPLKDGHTSLGDQEIGDDVSFPNKPYYTSLFLQEFLEINNLTQIDTPEQESAAIAYLEEQVDLLNNIITSYAQSESDITVAANGQLMWFIVEGIGYLQIAGMGGFADASEDDQKFMEDNLLVLENTLDQAMNELQDTNGLIVDIRRNGGGMDFISLAIASRFTENERVVYRKQARLGDSRTELRDVTISPRGSMQYLKPVALLTSASTLSAAEVFTMSMDNLPHVTLIGESTQGEFSDALEKKLPLGIPFSLSNEFYLTTNGEWLEGQGVPVDLALPAFALEERAMEVDLTLEEAFEFLSAN